MRRSTAPSITKEEMGEKKLRDLRLERGETFAWELYRALLKKKRNPLEFGERVLQSDLPFQKAGLQKEFGRPKIKKGKN